MRKYLLLLTIAITSVFAAPTLTQSEADALVAKEVEIVHSITTADNPTGISDLASMKIVMYFKEDADLLFDAIINYNNYPQALDKVKHMKLKEVTDTGYIFDYMESAMGIETQLDVEWIIDKANRTQIFKNHKEQDTLSYTVSTITDIGIEGYCKFESTSYIKAGWFVKKMMTMFDGKIKEETKKQYQNLIDLQKASAH